MQNKNNQGANKGWRGFAIRASTFQMRQLLTNQ